MWNVKEVKTSYVEVPGMVLIETLWNVKKYYAGIGADGRIVLIETLWNVKLEDKLINDEMHVGINRNIVECKV